MFCFVDFFSWKMKILTKCVNQIFTLGPWVSMTYKLQVNSNPRETYRSLLGCYVSSLLHWEVPSWPLDTVCAWKPKALTASKANQTKQNKRNEKKIIPLKPIIYQKKKNYPPQTNQISKCTANLCSVKDLPPFSSYFFSFLY